METLDKQIQTHGIKKKYSKKALLFSAGDEALGFFVILSREVRVFRMNEQAREVEVVRQAFSNGALTMTKRKIIEIDRTLINLEEARSILINLMTIA